MTNREREQIIKNAIGEYKAAIISWQPVKKKKIVNTINMMQNVYIMCSNWSVKGTEELRQTIIEAEKKLTEMEGNMEIIGRYKADTEEIVISQYPNGKRYKSSAKSC